MTVPYPKVDALKKKSLPCSWEGFFAVRESRYEGFDKVESLGKGGGVGGGNLSPERFPSPTFLLSLSLSLSLFPYYFTGTVEIALKGEPSTRRRLTAR